MYVYLTHMPRLDHFLLPYIRGLMLPYMDLVIHANNVWKEGMKSWDEVQ